MTCWFVKGVRREEDGAQVKDDHLVVSLSCRAIKERSSAKDMKESVKKSLLWFLLPWGWRSFQSLSTTERMHESF